MSDQNPSDKKITENHTITYTTEDIETIIHLAEKFGPPSDKAQPHHDHGYDESNRPLDRGGNPIIDVEPLDIPLKPRKIQP